jgi:hypothetical protein
MPYIQEALCFGLIGFIWRNSPLLHFSFGPSEESDFNVTSLTEQSHFLAWLESQLTYMLDTFLFGYITTLSVPSVYSVEYLIFLTYGFGGSENICSL